MKQILGIDVGNTQIKFYLIGEDIIFLDVCDTLSKEKDILNILKKVEVKTSYLSSVVPDATKKIKNALAKLNITCEEIIAGNYEDILPMAMENKAELGSDIYLGCVAASKLSNDAIIIDMGTATTIAKVQNNTFIGCAIIPGVKTSYAALFINAALLDNIEIAKPDDLIGNNTVTSVQIGMYYGSVGAIKEIIEKFNLANAKIVFTGGLAKYYYQEFENATFEETLIIKGMKIISEYRGEK